MRPLIKKTALGLALGILLASGNGFCESRNAFEWKSCGDECLRKGKASLAIADYQKAILSEPSSTALYFNLAIAYYSAGNIKKAAATLEKLVELDPGDAEAYYNLGCLKLYLKEPETAKACFQKAQMSSPAASAFFSLSRSSLLFLEKLKELDPQAQDILFLLFRRGLPALKRAA